MERGLANRLRWLVLFSVLACALSIAVSALPASAVESPEAPPSAPEEQTALPSDEEVATSLASAFDAYRDELEQREEQLAAPASVAERLASQHAFANLTPEEAQELLQSKFGYILEALNKDPARFLSDAEIEATTEPDSATVTSEGESSLLESSIPVQTPAEDGELDKVDISLVKTQDGWEPVNPLIDLEIGATAEEGVELEETGVAITHAGSEGSVARRLGDKNLFYPEVTAAEDTDLLVSPTAMGVELFNLLRSIDSPETLRFQIETPAGAQLRMNDFGAAEVVAADGSPLAWIPRPVAFDAQGTSVPVEMSADGDHIVLNLNHRDEDLAYPILVDPTVYQNWGGWHVGQNLQGLDAWKWAPESPTPTPWWLHYGRSETMWPGVTALFIATEPGNLGANQWGHYFYRAPNENSYLADASVSPFHRNNRSCPSPNPYYQPYDYAGMYGDTGWNRVLFNKANELGWVNLESWGRMLAIGMSTNNGTYIPCWRDLMIGGVSIWLDDWQYPYLDSVGPTPEGWVKKDGTPRSFSVSASDAGLGVQNVRMFGVGTQEWRLRQNPCAGTYENRCPNTDSGQITFTTNGFPYEGRYTGTGAERKFTIQAVDPTNKTWQLERSLWLDGTPPVISLSGQLATSTDQVGTTEKAQETAAKDDELSMPTYKLSISTDDGADRSGVKEIKVYLDKDPSLDPNAVPTEVKSVSCPTAGCERSLGMDYTLRLPGLTPGKHSLWIVAVDKVGNSSDPKRNIEFEYIPATGMKEEFVLQHFRLPDGNDYSGEAEYHGPEIAVNVMNGNVVYHERDVDVEADRGELELERIYNSQQPTQKDTQWGRGWSVAQAPVMEPLPGSSPPQKATVTRTGKITSAVPIPQVQSQTTFSSRLRATITKTTSGYEVKPTTAEEVEVFNSSGRIEEVVQGDNSPVYLEGEEAEPVPPSPPTYTSAFGSLGSGSGQFKHPAGIAIDGSGSIWVVDQDNYRVQKFNAAGEYQSSFGSQGTGNGQFGRPTDIAVDAAGNLWVTDAGNSRVQKFNNKGEFLAKYGSYGSGNGQFSSAESIAIDAKGNIWIGDTYNARLQKFNLSFEFIGKYGSYGTGQGQLIEPTGIDVAPNGSVWIADWGNNRVSVFDESGAFVRQFGSSGTGNGQFARPDVIEVDGKGNVWVGDQNNGRVQQFNQSGEFVTQFGTKGSGAGQFSFGWPMGIASDSKGNLWVSDTANNRVQRWSASDSIGGGGGGGLAPYFKAPVVDYEYDEGKLTDLKLEDEATPGEDPSLEMTLSSGLVSGVDSEEAGDTTYGYESGKLKTVGGVDGETKYGHDSSGRLNSVTLPNGTVATITYDSTSRATSVKVDPAGPETAKTTNFAYSAEPRRTTVWGGGSPEIIYDIGEDGSVFKWSYAETPPTIASISGSLWSKKGQEIENKDHTLFVTGSSPHGVGKIQILVNGNAVAEEEICEDTSVPPAHNCDQPPPLEWITHAAAHPAGRLDIEVVVTDFLGHQSAERFFVVVPQQPPPDPETVPPPSFTQIKLFREEFGLDRETTPTESQLNELILELLYEWEGHDPVAMYAVEKWGVPLRQPEVSDLEFRESYIAQAAELIPQWAESNAPTTYGGYYVDNRQGGKIYVGFTSNQAALVEALKASPGLLAPGQIGEYSVAPVRSVATAEATEASVMAAISESASVFGATSSVGIEPGSTKVAVGTTDINLLTQYLETKFASGTFEVSYQAPEEDSYSRFKASGPVDAGTSLTINGESHWCTAGFGATEKAGALRGQPTEKYFVLSAAHCFDNGTRIYRAPSRGSTSLDPVGVVRRNGYVVPGGAGGGNNEDASAVLLDNPGLLSGRMFVGNPHVLYPLNGPQPAPKGTTVCSSGVEGGVNCGPVRRVYWSISENKYAHRVVEVAAGNVTGDSGGPVWNPKTGAAVGLMSSHNGLPNRPCHKVKSGQTFCPRQSFTPLVPYKGQAAPMGALPFLGVSMFWNR